MGSRRRLGSLLFLTLVVGCTPTVNRLEPYRDDAVAAGKLEASAEQLCRERRGPAGVPPHRFTTDGCSWWPDGTWVECCVTHDMWYWCGGSCDEREHADADLRQCVAANGPGGMGTTMYLGVRVGGAPWYPVPFRWGYGWDWPHGYDDEVPAKIEDESSDDAHPDKP